MKNFLALLCLTTSFMSFAQDFELGRGDNVAKVDIIVNKEFFELSNKEHKDFLGLYLKATPYIYNDPDYERIEAAPFELHVRGGNLGKLQIAEAKAAAIRYLNFDPGHNQISFHGEAEGIQFNYRDFGASESDPAKKIQILDFNFGTLKPGLRYTNSKGGYFVIGGIASVIFPGKVLNKDKQALGYSMKQLAEGEDADFQDKEFETEGAVGQFQGGGFVEVNLNQKLKLEANSTWVTRENEHAKFNYIRKYTEPTEDINQPGRIFDRPMEARQTGSISRIQSKIDVKVTADLGKLISPRLTGVNLYGGFENQRYNIDYQETGTFDVPKRSVVKINQNMFSVGLKLSPSTILKRAKEGKKYEKMLDIYR